MTKLVLNDVTNISGAESTALGTINNNYDSISAAIENTLSRDGSNPNQMNADLDMNNNDILNVDNLTVETLILNGVTLTPNTPMTEVTPIAFGGTNATNLIEAQYNLQTLPSFRPEAYGAVANGVTDDKSAIEAAATAAVSGKGKLVFSPNKVYAFSTLAIPDNTVIEAQGAVLRDKGTNTGSTVSVVFGNAVIADSLKITSPGTETNTNIVSFGLGFTAGLFHIESDVQRTGSGGVICTGQDIKIAHFKSNKIERPLHFWNQATGAGQQTTGSWIGFFDVKSYIRAFRADYCYGWRIDSYYITDRSPNAVAKTPGQNTFLIGGCSDWSIGDGAAWDAPEHNLRIGGSPHANCRSDNWVVGNMYGGRTGSCMIKVNPTRLVSAGVTETCENFMIGEVMGVDVGYPISGNSELVRITHGRSFSVGPVLSTTNIEAVSSQYLVILNDCDDFEVTVEGTDVNAGLLSINGTSDVDGVLYFGGDVTNGIINLRGECNGSNVIGVNTAFNLSNVEVRLSGIRGFTTNVLSWSAGTLTGPFRIEGTVGGAVAPVFSGAPASDNFQVDIRYTGKRVIGRGGNLRYTAALELVIPSFDSGSAAPAGLMLSSVNSTAGSGNYGGGIEGTRLGSTRRGWAIVPRQNSADDKEVDVTFWVGDSTSTANEGLLEAMRLSKERALLIPDGITAPSTTAGWATLYVDTADGDLKIKFGDGTIKTIVVDT